MKRIPEKKLPSNVLTMDQMVELLEVTPYDDPNGRCKDTLSEWNWEYIETRAASSYAYDHDLEWDHGTLTKECPTCEGSGDIEHPENDVVVCPACDGAGKIELDFETICETEEYEKLYGEVERELYEAWLNAVDDTAETAFDNLDMNVEVVEIRRKHERGYWYERAYLITPEVSWKETAQAVADCVSGYGYFHFSTAKDLKDSYPYSTYKAAVMEHLYVTEYPRVYGSESISSIFDGNLRHYMRNW